LSASGLSAILPFEQIGGVYAVWGDFPEGHVASPKTGKNRVD